MSKTQQLQDAFDDAKQHANHLPVDGRIQYDRRHGYSIWSRGWHGLAHEYRDMQYCWLGSFDRGMRFLINAKATGMPNFANLRVGVR